MIGEAELGRLLIEHADDDAFRRSVGIPTIEEDLLNTMQVVENLEALLDPFPLPPSGSPHWWEHGGS